MSRRTLLQKKKELNQVILNQSPADKAARIKKKKLQLATDLSDILKEKKISYSAFAGRMGKQPSEISKWLSGVHNFTTDTLFEIESELGIKIVSAKPEHIIKNITIITGNHHPEEVPVLAEPRRKVASYKLNPDTGMVSLLDEKMLLEVQN